MTEKKLTPKERKFVSGILKGKSQTKAAEEAGIPKKRARQQGCRMRTNANIAKAIEEGREKLSKKFELEEDYEIKHAKNLAEISEQHLVNDEGEFNSGAAQSLNQSLKLIGQIRGKFVSKIQVGLAEGFADALESVDAES